MKVLYGLTGALLFVVSIACSNPTDNTGTNQQSAQQTALNKAHDSVIYTDKNQIELDNYNRRQSISDNPATILWCTSSFPQPNSPMFTVPIVGKLTSGGKRPYPTQQVQGYYERSYTYFPELPGPDGMYGTSGEYRYGFTPAGFYVDFYNIATFCTTELTVFQRQSTTVMLAQDNGVNAAQTAAQAILGAPAVQAACKQDANGKEANAAVCADAKARATALLLASVGAKP